MTDKVAVITGGGTGIGKAVAVRLAEKGWKLALLGRRLDKLEAAAAAAGGDALIIQCDVGDSGAVQAAFTEIAGRFGRVDFLFNNAGMGAMPVEVDEHDIAAWDRVVSVNLSGCFYCAREAFGIMKRQDPRGGRIVNNGSISAHVPRPKSIAYTATKHALTGLTKSLFLDGRPYDIVAGQIDIGNTLTDLAIVMTQGMPQANGTTAVEPTFDVGHVADAVALMAELPLDSNVPFMTIMASKMPYIGRG
jgi:NAD(P)-dependent dehydrogenase (short-subunit alcohol dehydrogenase family)